MNIKNKPEGGSALADSAVGHTAVGCHRRLVGGSLPPPAGRRVCRQVPLQRGLAAELSLRYISASLVVWSLALVTTAFCPSTSSKNAERRGKQDRYS